jgi:hypothetical protein
MRGETASSIEASRERPSIKTEACTSSSSLVQEADWQSSAAYSTYSQVKVLGFKARINVSVQVIACRNFLVTGAYFMKVHIS